MQVSTPLRHQTTATVLQQLQPPFHRVMSVRVLNDLSNWFAMSTKKSRWKNSARVFRATLSPNNE
jgi:hypothetical protein